MGDRGVEERTGGDCLAPVRGRDGASNSSSTSIPNSYLNTVMGGICGDDSSPFIFLNQGSQTFRPQSLPQLLITTIHGGKGWGAKARVWQERGVQQGVLMVAVTQQKPPFLNGRETAAIRSRELPHEGVPKQESTNVSLHGATQGCVCFCNDSGLGYHCFLRTTDMGFTVEGKAGWRGDVLGCNRWAQTPGQAALIVRGTGKCPLVQGFHM